MAASSSTCIAQVAVPVERRARASNVVGQHDRDPRRRSGGTRRPTGARSVHRTPGLDGEPRDGSRVSRRLLHPQPQVDDHRRHHDREEDEAERGVGRVQHDLDEGEDQAATARGRGRRRATGAGRRNSCTSPRRSAGSAGGTSAARPGRRARCRRRTRQSCSGHAGSGQGRGGSWWSSARRHWEGDAR